MKYNTLDYWIQDWYNIPFKLFGTTPASNRIAVLHIAAPTRIGMTQNIVICFMEFEYNEKLQT